MNYKKIIFATLIIPYIFLNCKDKSIKEKNYHLPKILINADHAIPEAKMSEMFSSIEYVKLESGEGHIIGSISQLIPYNGRFYIFDETQTNTVFCFQNDGKFLFKIDRKGNGPGEYNELSSISINPDKKQLLLYCSSLHKIIICDLEGNYIRSSKLDFYATRFTYLTNGYSAFFCDYGSNQKLHKNNTFPNFFVTKSDNFDIQSVDLPFSDKTNFGAMTMNATCFSSYDKGEVSMLVPYNDTIYHVTPDKLKRAYYFDFGKKKKTESFYDLLFNPTTLHNDVQTYMMGKDICNVIYYIESSDYIFFSYQNKDAYHFSFYRKYDEHLVDVFKRFGSGSDNSIPIINDIDGGLFSMPLATDGKVFYGVVETYDILNRKDDILQSQTPDKQKLITILEKLTINDNPIIAIQTPVMSKK